MQLYPTVREAAHMGLFPCCLINFSRLRTRKKPFSAGRWILDSQGFEQIRLYGEYQYSPEEYIQQGHWLSTCGTLVAIVTQDYPVTPLALARTGLTLQEHQSKTIERYDLLRRMAPSLPWMAVIHGTGVEEYVEHLQAYGYQRLPPGVWVGVGSLKQFGDLSRSERISNVRSILKALKAVRPDLRFHGFGVGLEFLKDSQICELLESADTSAWCYAARKEGRNQDDPQEAIAYAKRVAETPLQGCLFEELSCVGGGVRLSYLIDLAQYSLGEPTIQNQGGFLKAASKILEVADEVAPDLDSLDPNVNLWEVVRTLFERGLIYDDTLGVTAQKNDITHYVKTNLFPSTAVEPVILVIAGAHEQRWELAKASLCWEFNENLLDRDEVTSRRMSAKN